MNSEHIRDEYGIYDDGPTTPEQTDWDHAIQLHRIHPRRERPFGTIWTHQTMGPEPENVFSQTGFNVGQEDLAAKMGEEPCDDDVLDWMSNRERRAREGNE